MGFSLPERRDWLKFAIDFCRQHAIACLFPFILVGLLALTKHFPLPGIARYDLLFLLCVLVQILMVLSKIETWKDAAVVAVFHLLGLGLEVYKVSHGSWSYPEKSVLVVAGAPLYSGFMHGSVASFMCLAWKRLSLRASNWPSRAVTLPTAALVYAQFFYPVWGDWARLLMVVAVCWLFRRSLVHFTCAGGRWHIPMSIAFLLIGFMIWVAENLATYFGAWVYPYQRDGWVMVHESKVLSWTLLMMVSLVIVAEYKRRLGLLRSEDWPIMQSPAREYSL
ncbi:MAG: DUF817 domain-containing protein [Armatimonadetes bacterium]|nr:DUF817 domain-containing protein [Armatimonadota bacterium]